MLRRLLFSNVFVWVCVFVCVTCADVYFKQPLRWLLSPNVCVCDGVCVWVCVCVCVTFESFYSEQMLRWLVSPKVCVCICVCMWLLSPYILSSCCANCCPWMCVCVCVCVSSRCTECSLRICMFVCLYVCVCVWFLRMSFLSSRSVDCRLQCVCVCVCLYDIWECLVWATAAAPTVFSCQT